MSTDVRRLLSTMGWALAGTVGGDILHWEFLSVLSAATFVVAPIIWILWRINRGMNQIRQDLKR